ncbi:amino acid ABC transporter permease [Streptomyces prunicolor]
MTRLPLSLDASTEPERRVVPRRHYGRLLASVALLLAAVCFFSRVAEAKIDYGVTLHYLANPLILKGMVNTLVISVLSMLIGLVLGTLSAVAALSRIRLLRISSALYIWVFRGTPVLVQLLLWYNAALVFPTVTVPGLGTYTTTSLITPFVAALVGLGINEGAYMSEIIRGGLISVGDGQRQAAQALGMTPFVAMRHVILPQAFRVALPGTGNQFVIMLKSSAMASVVQYSELLNVTENVYQRNFAIIELLLVASFWYIVLTTVFTVVQSFIERRLGRSVRGHQSASKSIWHSGNWRRGKGIPWPIRF